MGPKNRGKTKKSIVFLNYGIFTVFFSIISPMVNYAYEVSLRENIECYPSLTWHLVEVTHCTFFPHEFYTTQHPVCIVTFSFLKKRKKNSEMDMS